MTLRGARLSLLFVSLTVFAIGPDRLPGEAQAKPQTSTPPEAKAAKTAKPSKSRKDQKAAPSSPSPTAVGPANGADSSIHRTVIHTKAYEQRKHLGQHLSIKITPPEKRGRKGRVLVELYNYSKSYLSVVDFWLYLYGDADEIVEVHITADDLKAGWSALKWVQIPKGATVPAIIRVDVKNMQMFSDKARKIELKYYTDLIKS